MTRDTSSAVRRSCPSHELLVAAVTGNVRDDEQRWLDTHLDDCDRCLDAVSTVLQRLSIADEAAAPVPDAVHQRATIAAALQTTDWQTTDNRRKPVSARSLGLWSDRLLSVVQRILRQPLMIPAAAAIVAVLVVATQTWITPSTPRSMTRSVVLQQHARVTALEAAVRRAPNSRAEVVATVTRGTLVTISGEERDWSHVMLPNGTEGWLDQGALR